MDEHKLQRNLSLAGLLSLASIPLTGGIGICAAIGIFSGKFLRLFYNENAAKNYENEEKSIEAERKQEREAFLQKREQEQQRLRNHERDLYSQAQAEADKYLSRLPPEEYNKVRKVRVYLPGQKRTFLGIPIGRRKSLEYEIVR
ncbi:hypothetical protein DRN73_06200 [Candidatus Pacearchaeota archaeon]|nr:MAG: hypothetical protein DRN73_06200 [Candidatus Pacearchaeota archaeon]